MRVGTHTNLGSFSSGFGSLGVLALCEEEIKLADKELLGSTQVVPSGQAERQFWVGQRVGYVWYHRLLVHRHREDLEGGEREGRGEGGEGGGRGEGGRGEGGRGEGGR